MDSNNKSNSQQQVDDLVSRKTKYLNTIFKYLMPLRLTIRCFYCFYCRGGYQGNTFYNRSLLRVGFLYSVTLDYSDDSADFSFTYISCNLTNTLKVLDKPLHFFRICFFT